MAVVVKAEDVEKFTLLAAEENLTATAVATVTAERHIHGFCSYGAVESFRKPFL